MDESQLFIYRATVRIFNFPDFSTNNIQMAEIKTWTDSAKITHLKFTYLTLIDLWCRLIY